MNLRKFNTLATRLHQNPLGLPQRGPPQIPKRNSTTTKYPIPHVKYVVAVASGKGGVGKSTVSVNIALALAQTTGRRRARVGLLDLDIFGPSIPKLMDLETVDEPALSRDGKIIPLSNHGLLCMSIGFLLPKSAPNDQNKPAVVWRGLMVQKAVQQLLFDVDWRGKEEGTDLDILVVDMPPGTGDVQLTLGQLVQVNGAIIVSTPQDVALIDARKGVSMFRKVNVPILGFMLNMSHFTCPVCTSPHHLFGPPTSFRSTALELSIPLLGELPLVPQISIGGDAGAPAMISSRQDLEETKNILETAAKSIWSVLDNYQPDSSRMV